MALVITVAGEDEELMQVTSSGKREEAADPETFRAGIRRPPACEWGVEGRKVRLQTSAWAEWVGRGSAPHKR